MLTANSIHFGKSAKMDCNSNVIFYNKKQNVTSFKIICLCYAKIVLPNPRNHTRWCISYNHT